jgi:hypothetical protein
MDTTLLQAAAVAAFLAIGVMAYELRASLAPPSCPDCPHCRAIAEERKQRDRELATWYARQHGLDSDEDDDRRIG